MAVLQAYLPQPLTDEELEAIIAETIAASGAKSVKDMGAVMNAIRARAAGRADMARVSAQVKAKLG